MSVLDADSAALRDMLDLQTKKKRSGERFYMTYEKSDLEVYTIARCEHIIVYVLLSLVSQLNTSVAT